MRRLLIFCLTISLFISLAGFGCGNQNDNPYKTFALNEGVVHFSLEYPSSYRTGYIKPATPNGSGSFPEFMSVTLDSPRIKGTNDHNYIKILADKPDNIVPDAKVSFERAERNAASWPDYALLYKGDITIDGIKAYRIDYQKRDIVANIAGASGHYIEIIREVVFDANGYVWMIQARSVPSTAEQDKIYFEHMLQTLKILD